MKGNQIRFSPIFFWRFQLVSQLPTLQSMHATEERACKSLLTQEVADYCRTNKRLPEFRRSCLNARMSLKAGAMNTTRLTHVNRCAMINRPSVPGAVLQTPL